MTETIDLNNIKFDTVYHTAIGDVEIIKSNYYGQKYFYILMLNNKVYNGGILRLDQIVAKLKKLFDTEGGQLC